MIEDLTDSLSLARVQACVHMFYVFLSKRFFHVIQIIWFLQINELVNISYFFLDYCKLVMFVYLQAALLRILLYRCLSLNVIDMKFNNQIRISLLYICIVKISIHSHTSSSKEIVNTLDTFSFEALYAHLCLQESFLNFGRCRFGRIWRVKLLYLKC